MKQVPRHSTLIIKHELEYPALHSNIVTTFFFNDLVFTRVRVDMFSILFTNLSWKQLLNVMNGSFVDMKNATIMSGARRPGTVR